MIFLSITIDQINSFFISLRGKISTLKRIFSRMKRIIDEIINVILSEEGIEFVDLYKHNKKSVEVRNIICFIGLKIGVSTSDIAYYLNLSPQTLSKNLKRFIPTAIEKIYLDKLLIKIKEKINYL